MLINNQNDRGIDAFDSKRINQIHPAARELANDILNKLYESKSIYDETMSKVNFST